jgi:hypothetical protein
MSTDAKQPVKIVVKAADRLPVKQVVKPAVKAVMNLDAKQDVKCLVKQVVKPAVKAVMSTVLNRYIIRGDELI